MNSAKPQEVGHRSKAWRSRRTDLRAPVDAADQRGCGRFTALAVRSIVAWGLLCGACGEEEAAPPPSDPTPLAGAPAGYGRGGLAYDSARDRLVYFGGYHANPEGGTGVIAYGATWEWDGATWIQVADAGPSPRYDLAMAYDPVRAVVVLYGGVGGCGDAGFACCDDTWTWNGVAWRAIEGPGPGARRGANLSYDPQRRSLLLFGGEPCQEGSDPRALWRFSGEAWSEVSP